MKVSLSRQELRLIIDGLWASQIRDILKDSNPERDRLAVRLTHLIEEDIILNGDPEATDQPTGVLESPVHRKAKGRRK